jgi:phage shock protein E
MKRFAVVALSLVVSSALTACAASNNNTKPNNETQSTGKESSTLKPSTSQSSTTNISVEEANKLLNENKNLVVLDVRTEEEYKSGHLKNALLMPYDQITSRISEIEKYSDKPVLVYCRSGNRSSVAVQTLEKKDFKNIYHMNEGISAWKYDLKK